MVLWLVERYKTIEFFLHVGMQPAGHFSTIVFRTHNAQSSIFTFAYLMQNKEETKVMRTVKVVKFQQPHSMTLRTSSAI